MCMCILAWQALTYCFDCYRLAMKGPIVLGSRDYITASHSGCPSRCLIRARRWEGACGERGALSVSPYLPYLFNAAASARKLCLGFPGASHARQGCGAEPIRHREPGSPELSSWAARRRSSWKPLRNLPVAQRYGKVGSYTGVKGGKNQCPGFNLEVIGRALSRPVQGASQMAPRTQS